MKSIVTLLLLAAFGVARAQDAAPAPEKPAAPAVEKPAAAAPKPAKKKAAHPAKKAPPPVAKRPPKLAPAELAARRAQFKAAYLVAQQGPAGKWRALASGLEDYSLWPYLEAASLTHDLPLIDSKVVTTFLDKHAGTPYAADLRRDWLRDLGDRERWAELVAAVTGDDKDVEVRCDVVAARVALKDTEGLGAIALDLLRTGRALPRACDAVDAWARAQGLANDDFTWERVQLAIDANEPGRVRALALSLPPDQRAEAQRYASLIEDPARWLDKARAWADTPRARAAVAAAIARYAAKDTEAAIADWEALSAKLKFDDAQRGRALAAIAIQRAASYAPDAVSWLAKVPAGARDARVMEWRVREALARQDYAQAQAALDEMPATLRMDPRWRYLGARIDELSGRPQSAQAAFRELANEANFFGFVSAEKLDLPYALCPAPEPDDAALRAKIAELPAFRRALELRELDWHDKARREWDYAMRGLDASSRAAAVAAADALGWHDRGPFTLTRGDEQRLYALRFPLAYREIVEQAARRRGLDPELVLGLIRSESAWSEDAVSHARAYGLMQVLPELAKEVARKEKLRYGGPVDLYKPELNIDIGTSHLADILARYDGAAWLALAAYNAGPTPVARWRAARGGLPPDLWVETIPYKETREYVERVLTFATIYGWRRDGSAVALSARFAPPGQVPALADAPRRAISCATHTATAGSAAGAAR